MKKAIIAYALVVLGFATLSGIIAPALVGQCRYEQAQQRIQYRMATEEDFGSDGDLVNVMALTGWDVGYSMSRSLSTTSRQGTGYHSKNIDNDKVQNRAKT
jgi:hypothetical protein